MSKFILTFTLLIASSIAAAAGVSFQYDAMECAHVAQKFTDHQFHMTVSDLDLLETCAASMKSMVINERSNQKEMAMFMHNNNYKDAE